MLQFEARVTDPLDFDRMQTMTLAHATMFPYDLLSIMLVWHHSCPWKAVTAIL